MTQRGTKIYGITIGGIIQGSVFSSLKGACELGGVRYTSAVSGKRVFLKGTMVIEIKELELVKVSSRGGHRIKGIKKPKL